MQTRALPRGCCARIPVPVRASRLFRRRYERLETGEARVQPDGDAQGSVGEDTGEIMMYDYEEEYEEFLLKGVKSSTRKAGISYNIFVYRKDEWSSNALPLFTIIGFMHDLRCRYYKQLNNDPYDKLLIGCLEKAKNFISNKIYEKGVTYTVTVK